MGDLLRSQKDDVQPDMFEPNKSKWRHFPVIVAILFILLVAGVVASAQAIYLGLVPTCDTDKQVATYLTTTGNFRERLKAVNTDSKYLCDMSLVAYERHETILKVLGADGKQYEIARITVVDYYDYNGWNNTVPFKQYSAFVLDD